MESKPLIACNSFNEASEFLLAGIMAADSYLRQPTRHLEWACYFTAPYLLKHTLSVKVSATTVTLDLGKVSLWISSVRSHIHPSCLKSHNFSLSWETDSPKEHKFWQILVLFRRRKWPVSILSSSERIQIPRGRPAVYFSGARAFPTVFPPNCLRGLWVYWGFTPSWLMACWGQTN